MDWMTPSSSLFRASTTKAPLALGLLVSGSKHPCTNTLSCSSLIFLFRDEIVSNGSHRRQVCVCLLGTYLMLGGEPAGINILPGEEGCLTNSTKMRIITMHGKRMTT